jgi:Stress responsive A/B Barrel Domain
VAAEGRFPSSLSHGTTMTIKHIVMWNVRGDDPATRRAHMELVKREFESLGGQVPGLLCVEVGIDESRIDYACDVVLYTEFASREALAAYAVHPEHLRVKQALGDLRVARHQVDYESADAPDNTMSRRQPHVQAV